MKLTRTFAGRLGIALLLIWAQAAWVSAQDGASSSPAGLAMLVLFLGIAGMIGVLVIRWSQTTQEDDD